MNIRDVMTSNPRCVTPDDSIENAARIMRDEDTGVVPVVENGRPVGVVTDRDIVVRAVADGGQTNRPVREICSGASSRPLGGRGMSVCSATSCAIATLTPPSSCMRSAMASTSSFCSS